MRFSHQLYSCAVLGIDGGLIEVDISQGLPAFTIVGLPDAATSAASNTCALVL